MKLYWNKWNNIENGEKFGMVYTCKEQKRFHIFSDNICKYQFQMLISNPLFELIFISIFVLTVIVIILNSI